MTAKISYQDIPKEERKRLEATIREEPKAFLFYCIIMWPHAFWTQEFFSFTDYIGKAIFPEEGSSLSMRLLVHFVVLIPIGAGIMFGLFRPWFRREVEKRWEEGLAQSSQATPSQRPFVSE